MQRRLAPFRQVDSDKLRLMPTLLGLYGALLIQHHAHDLLRQGHADELPGMQRRKSRAEAVSRQDQMLLRIKSERDALFPPEIAMRAVGAGGRTDGPLLRVTLFGDLRRRALKAPTLFGAAQSRRRGLCRLGPLGSRRL